MKKFVCEMCSGNDLIKEGDYFVCQSCGTKFSPEDAKKMFVEGTVKIDNSDLISNILIVAKTALKNFDYALAKDKFTELLNYSPNSAEYSFYRLYCDILISKISEFPSRYSSLSNAFENICNMLKTEDIPDEKKKKIYLDMFDSLCDLHNTIDNMTNGNLEGQKNRYLLSSMSNMFFLAERVEKEYNDNATSSKIYLFVYNYFKDADEIYRNKMFKDPNSDMAKIYNKTKDLIKTFNDVYTECCARIKKYDSSFVPYMP